MAKISATKNYRLFDRSEDNRPLDPRKHKRLKKSMEKYGFLPCYPIVCIRDKQQKLVILDGQHRQAIAETLSLPVYYTIIEKAFDIAQVNSTQEKWNTRNYAETYATQGKAVYQEGLEFADRHGIAVGIAFALLSGVTNFSCIAADYCSGNFRIKDRNWAETVGAVYANIISTAPRLKNARLIEACMAVARVKDFDLQRLLGGIDRCREKLIPYSTRDAYLDMLESIYNFGRSKLVGLKVSAIQVMRDRDPSNGKYAKDKK